MLGIHDLALFIISGLLLNVTPGPDKLGKDFAHGGAA